MNCVDRPCTVALSLSIPVTVLICAIWLVTWALSIGLSGSWFCICATSSFRKRSEVTVASFVLATAGVEVTLTSLVVEVGALTAMSFSGAMSG